MHVVPTAVVVLAHQGGWDEALLVITPIGIFAGLFVLANRRARAQQEANTTSIPNGSEEPCDSPTSEGGT